MYVTDYCRAAALFFLISLECPALGQRGVIVESVRSHSASETARITPGDVVLRWSNGQTTADISTPFDLLALETEAPAHHQITIQGIHNQETKEWRLPSTGNWGLEIRPALSGTLLLQYQQGCRLESDHKVPEAAQTFRLLSDASASFTRPRERGWLLFRSAKVFTRSNHWANADQAFQDAINAVGRGNIGDRSRILATWADSFTQRNDFITAEKYYERALAEQDSVASVSFAVVEILDDLASLVIKLNKFDRAQQYLHRALEAAQHLAKNSIPEAHTLNLLGNVQRRLGKVSDAEQSYVAALKLEQLIAPESLLMASTLNNLGLAAVDHGDIDEAEEYHHRALAIRQRLVPESSDVAASYNNLGNVSLLRGDLRGAERAYHEALALLRRGGRFNSLAIATLNENLGNVALKRWDFVTAEKAYLTSMRIAESIAPGTLAVTTDLDNLGVIARLRGDLATAEQYHKRSLAIEQKAAPNSLDLAGTLNLLGDLAKNRGDLNTARAFYLRSLLIRKTVAPYSLDTSYSLYELGEVDSHGGKLNAARHYFEDALAIRAKLVPNSVSYTEVLAALASVIAREGRREIALGLYERALTALETQTARLGGAREIRIGFRSQQTQYYRDYASLLIEARRYSEALSVLERSRAQTLREMLIDGHVNVQKGIDSTVLKRLHTLQEAFAAKANYRISLLRSTLRSTPSQDELKRVDQDLERLLNEYQTIQAEIQLTSPGYAALMQPSSLTVDRIQHRLIDGNTVLLEYMLGSHQSYVFVVTSSTFHVRRLPRGSEIAPVARQLYNTIRTPNASWDGAVMNNYYSLAFKLSQMVVAPVYPELAGKRLVIVADGFLNYIPFSALLDVSVSDSTFNYKSPLMLNHEIVMVPSAATLSLVREQGAKHHKAIKEVAVLADPVFFRDDERLPGQRDFTRGGGQDVSENSQGQEFSLWSTGESSWNPRSNEINLTRLYYSGEEARRILAAAPPGRGVALLGFEANRETVLSGRLEGYRIVHFATHAVMNEQRPELSGLVLSLVDKNGRPRNGFVGLQDIYNLNLPTELVVLSACNTALGKNVQGEGMIGLTHAFLYAGASRVLASLWQVDDHATADFMGWLYEAIEKHGMTPAAAVRQAQIKMWRNPNRRAPFFWAAFQLFGEN